MTPESTGKLTNDRGNGPGMAAWVFPELEPLHMPEEAVSAGIYSHTVAEIFGLEDEDGNEIPPAPAIRRSSPESPDNPQLAFQRFSNAIKDLSLSVPEPLMKVAYDLAWESDIHTAADFKAAAPQSKIDAFSEAASSLISAKNLSPELFAYAIITTVTLCENDASLDDLLKEFEGIAQSIGPGGALADKIDELII